VFGWVRGGREEAGGGGGREGERPAMQGSRAGVSSVLFLAYTSILHTYALGTHFVENDS